jgi:hypothetical protein
VPAALLFSLLASCVTTTVEKKKPEEQTCAQLYDELNQSTTSWVGYGTSISPSAAVDSARADLVLQIRTRVHGSTSVSDSNKDVQVNADARSDFSEEILGLKVVRRCERAGRHEAVVQLARSMFLKNLAGMIGQRNSQAADLTKQLQQDQNSAAGIRQLISARRFLRDHLSRAGDHLLLCRNFGGCRDTDLAALQQLENTVNANFTRLQFQWRGENDLAVKLRSTILLLLRKEGFAVSDQPQSAAADTSRIASTACYETVFPKAPGMRELFVEISCRVEGQVGGNQVFSLSYAAKGFGNTKAEAAGMATVSLEREAPQ